MSRLCAWLVAPTPEPSAPVGPAVPWSALGATLLSDFELGDHYLESGCCTNAHRLLGLARAAGADLTQARVLYILPKSVAGEIRPARARGGDVSWGFHVVVEAGGFIYDPDFGPRAFPPDVTRYFHRMFPGQQDRLQIRTVPAADYWRDYQHRARTGFGSYRYYTELNPYPKVSLREYLAGWPDPLDDAPRFRRRKPGASNARRLKSAHPTP